MLDYGFRVVALDPIVAVTRRENAGSRHVLEKLGLGYRGLRFHYGLNVAFYELARSDYLAARRLNAPAGADRPSPPPG